MARCVGEGRERKRQTVEKKKKSGEEQSEHGHFGRLQSDYTDGRRRLTAGWAVMWCLVESYKNVILLAFVFSTTDDFSAFLRR